MILLNTCEKTNHWYDLVSFFFTSFNELYWRLDKYICG